VKVLAVEPTAIEAVVLVRFARFRDERGYFTETFRSSDLQQHPALPDSLRLHPFTQGNESRSRRGVVRGLHFQWNPQMGKLVRTLAGHMVDLFLDLRPAAPTYGQIAAVDMPANPDADYDEWIWIPPGFAHGNYFLADSQIEYLCTGEYSPGCEAGISPFADDLDWSRCDPRLRETFTQLTRDGAILSEKDRQGLSLAAWAADPRADACGFAAL
jgi:dTDP-4-dehydrorhamnose 3,5-epimerase